MYKNMFFVLLVLLLEDDFGSCTCYFPDKTFQSLVLQTFIYGYLIIGLYKLLLEYLVVRVTQIGWMYCLLWWQMQETVAVLQSQVLTAHQL